MEEKAPLAHGDEQVLPITAAPFIVLLGFDRNSSGISKRQIELFALGIPDSDSETDSPPPPPLLKQKLNPHVVMDLPRIPDQYSLQHLADPFTVSVMLRPLMLAALSGVLLHRRLPDITLIPSSLTTSYMFWLV